MVTLLLALPVPDSSDVGAVVRDVLASGRFQTELPDSVSSAATESGVADPKRREARRRLPRGRRRGRDASDELVNSVVLILAVGVTIVLIGWFFVRTRNSIRERTPPSLGDSPAAETAVSLRADDSLERALALAEASRWADAIHALLVAALVDVSRARGEHLRDWWTAQAVLSRLQGTGYRPPLERLTFAVEHSLFGARQMDRTDWDLARQDLEDLRAALAEAGTESEAGSP